MQIFTDIAKELAERKLASKPKSKPVKRPGYREAVAWIALNDDQDLSGEGGALVTIMLVADLWDKEPEAVTADVQRYRDRQDD